MGVFQSINKIPVAIEIHFLEVGIKNAMKIGNTISPAKSDSFPVNWFEKVCFRKKSLTNNANKQTIKIGFSS